MNTIKYRWSADQQTIENVRLLVRVALAAKKNAARYETDGMASLCRGQAQGYLGAAKAIYNNSKQLVRVQ